jgi:predicted nucleotidyltransferase component of viral defense system
MKASKFYSQVKLLLDVLPFVAKEKCFALKGGTAINLFVRDFPRLSVDIDLTYLGNEERETALQLTEESLHRIKADLESRQKFKVSASSRDSQTTDIKLFVRNDSAQIKIEANPVTRGTLHGVSVRSLTEKAVEEFEVEVEMQVSSLPDLYGGKIAAALDRQHPRDLFDIKLLFENEGLTSEIKEGFITYLLCHKRPPNEIICPTFLDQKRVFETEFVGMSQVAFSYPDFEKTRLQLVEKIKNSLTANDIDFLFSFFNGKPDWELFTAPQAQQLPAIKWKLLNIEKMLPEKRNYQVSELKRKLKG